MRKQDVFFFSPPLYLFGRPLLYTQFVTSTSWAHKLKSNWAASNLNPTNDQWEEQQQRQKNRRSSKRNLTLSFRGSLLLCFYCNYIPSRLLGGAFENDKTLQREEHNRTQTISEMILINGQLCEQIHKHTASSQDAIKEFPGYNWQGWDGITCLFDQTNSNL